jgi:hypothetical protein
MPTVPGDIMTIPADAGEFVDGEDQTEYRSVVRMLLYLTKHSQPELSN